MKQFFSRLIDMPAVSDPDDRRRGRLLNMLLVGFAALSLFGIVFSGFFLLGGAEAQRRSYFLIFASALLLFLGILGIYQLNRRGKITLSASLFLFLVVVAEYFGDKPEALLSGRSLYFLVLPIMMASMLIRPAASFVAAGLISLGLIAGIVLTGYETNVFVGPLGIFAAAFIAWLSSRTLEDALAALRTINQELDQRVIQRTQELADANQRLELQARSLAEANERLKSLDVLKSKFVSDVTHELRTPISNLMIYMEMLRVGKAEKQNQYLSVLQEETSRLAQLIEDILDLSRMELGTKQVSYGWIDIHHIVEQIVTVNRIRAEAKGLTITLDADATIPRIWADSNQIGQVCNNLFGNAVTYTSVGKVTVRLSYSEARREVCLQVEDTGPGIAPEDLPHVFERFYRGGQASQMNIPGTGLGLSITKEIVEFHKGRIEVQSELGFGSVFYVYLPVGDSEESLMG